MISKNAAGQTLNPNYNATVRSSSRQWRARLVHTDGTIIACDIKRLETTGGSCGADTFTVGSVAGSSVKADVVNLTEDLKDTRVCVDIGMLIGDDYEWVRLGQYKITDIKQDHYTTSLTGYGRVVADSSGEFHAPTNPTLARVRVQLGIELGCTVGLESEIDATQVITEPLDNLTTYQVMQIVAGVVGGYITDIQGGNVRICRYKNSQNTTIDAKSLSTTPPVWADEDFEVTGIRCIVTEASTDADGAEIPAVGYEYGDPVNIELTNKYMTQGLFDDMTTGQKPLIGIKYRPGKVELALGDPRLESTDVVNFIGLDGVTYRVPCHQIKHVYDGGFTTEITAAAGTAEDAGIGTKTPMQQLLHDIKSRIVGIKDTADKARTLARNTAQYFWATETGTDTGAHITEIPKDDFLQDPENGGGNLLARSNGIAVRDGLTELATFSKDAVEIGQNGSGAKMTADSFSIAKNQWTFFDIKDLAGEEYIETIFVGREDELSYGVGAQIKDIVSVTVDGVAATVTKDGSSIVFANAPAEGAYIVARWTTDAIVPAMSFGGPLFTGQIGARSAAFGQSRASGDNAFACGRTTRATGIDSHVEGRYSAATGGISHAEGQYAEASGNMSHAEGYQAVAEGEASHAEGDSTEAKGIASHAGGSGAVAEGHGSFAHGLMIKSDGEDMVTLGRCNDVGNATPSGGDYALVIGNGIFDEQTQTVISHSDALKLDWDGNLEIHSIIQSGGYVYPESFGAKGDGTADDTAAIQAAIDTGKPVMLTAKTYKTTDTLRITNDCTALINHGTISYSGADFAVIIEAASSADKDKVWNKNYNFGVITTGSTAAGCIKIDSATGKIAYLNIRFTDLHCENTTNGIGVLMTQQSHYINEIRFFGGWVSAGKYGFKCLNEVGGTKNHYSWWHVGFEGVKTGVYLDNELSQLYFYGCRMEETTTNLFETDPDQYSKDNRIYWFNGRVNPEYLKLLKNYLMWIVGDTAVAGGTRVNKTLAFCNGMWYGASFRDVGTQLIIPAQYVTTTTTDTDGDTQTNDVPAFLKSSTANALRRFIRTRPLSADGVTKYIEVMVSRDMFTPDDCAFGDIGNEYMIYVTVQAGQKVRFIDKKTGNVLYTRNTTYTGTTYMYITLYYVANYGLVMQFEDNNSYRSSNQLT